MWNKIWIWIICTFYGHDTHTIHSQRTKWNMLWKCNRCGKTSTKAF